MRNPCRTAHVFELDGSLHYLEGQRLTSVKALEDVAGDKWLVTDFQESLSRVMTVEGPAKYAELLVRKRLQESGEFEEPVQILSHWKRKLGKGSTEVFFTAVPTRLAGYYFDELRQLPHIALVFSIYGVLWHTLQRSRSKVPTAVVLRHHRFAEVLVGTPRRVYFANRCVAFDTEPAQIEALWHTVQSDIEAVEREHRLQVGRVIYLNWLDTEETPLWPEAWLQRVVPVPAAQLEVGEQTLTVAWPAALGKESAGQSVSALPERLFHITGRLAPAMNLALALLAGMLLLGMVAYQRSARGYEMQIRDLGRQMAQVQLRAPNQEGTEGFDKLLDFVTQMDSNRKMPSYRQIIDDLTQGDLRSLVLQQFKVDYASQQVRLELSGDIRAPFDQAHGGYQRFLKRLRERGYQIDESHFETRINASKVVLKLSRPAI